MVNIADKVENILADEQKCNMWVSSVTQMLMREYGVEVTRDFLAEYVKHQTSGKLSTDRDYKELTRTNIRMATAYLMNVYEI